MRVNNYIQKIRSYYFDFIKEALLTQCKEYKTCNIILSMISLEEAVRNGEGINAN